VSPRSPVPATFPGQHPALANTSHLHRCLRHTLCKEKLEIHHASKSVYMFTPSVKNTNTRHANVPPLRGERRRPQPPIFPAAWLLLAQRQSCSCFEEYVTGFKCITAWWCVACLGSHEFCTPTLFPACLHARSWVFLSIVPRGLYCSAAVFSAVKPRYGPRSGKM
jgi:hypothetical protein